MDKPAQRHGQHATTEGLGLAALLSLLLLLLSFWRMLGDMGSAEFNLSVVEGALDEPLWRSRLGFNSALFALALIGLHLVYGFMCWLLAVASGIAHPSQNVTRRQWVLLWTLGTALCLLISNAGRFPHSSLGAPYSELVNTSVLGVPLHVGTSLVLGLAVATTLACLLARSWKLHRRASLLACSVLLVPVAGLGMLPAKQASISPSRPNVFFIGVDSLRQDAVDPARTPHIHQFMTGAVRMTEAITPLARTFPSWVAILTGRHPHTTGAYQNLLPRDRLRVGNTLPALLRAHGYETSYGIDETRFSNIDASYGFDQTFTPTIGGTDFVLAWFADTPLSNLVMNTALGAALFPHIHANRAAHFTYDPDVFVERVGNGLKLDGPTFAAVHFTLAHWPFTWATSTAETGNNRKARGDYDEAVHRVDQQVGNLLEILERRGALKNAVVVILSDHGEALGRPGDFLTQDFPNGDDDANEFQHWGHGTSVFSPQQYRVVLGVRAYGEAARLLDRTGVTAEPVSLVDLTPTMLELLDISTGESFDGHSFAPLLRAHASPEPSLPERIRFTESEYNPQGFSPEDLTGSALALAASIYRLDPRTDRIEIRKEKAKWVLANRQYAAIAGTHTMVAAVPGIREDGQFALVPIRGIRASGAPQDDPDEPARIERLRLALEEKFRIRIAPAAGPAPGARLSLQVANSAGRS